MVIGLSLSQRKGNIFFNQQLYYRGKHIRNYQIKIDYMGGE